LHGIRRGSVRLIFPMRLADLVAIARGLIDKAGARGDVDATALQSRVLRAVLGYLLGPAGALGAARRRSGPSA